MIFGRAMVRILPSWKDHSEKKSPGKTFTVTLKYHSCYFTNMSFWNKILEVFLI